MSTDIPKTVAGSESDERPGVTQATDAPPLSELQQAILARARETIARRDAKPRKSRSQLLVALAVSLVLALIAFAGLNYLVAEAQRMIGQYAASKKEEPTPPAAPQASEDPGVVILQPDRTLVDPNAPAKAPPAESSEGQERL